MIQHLHAYCILLTLYVVEFDSCSFENGQCYFMMNSNM